MKKFLKWTAITLGVLLVLGGAMFAWMASQVSPDLEKGQPLPAATLKDPAGKPIDLGDGQAVDVVAAPGEQADHAREHARLVVDQNRDRMALLALAHRRHPPVPKGPEPACAGPTATRPGALRRGSCPPRSPVPAPRPRGRA